jgi:hypothetical protein
MNPYFLKSDTRQALRPLLSFFLFACAMSCAGTSGQISEVKTNDTLFIYRNVSPDSYHAIFIDTLRVSQHKSRLANFDFSGSDQKTFRDQYESTKIKSAREFAKHPISLSRNWLPVFQHKEKYYVYAPCDWGVTGRISLADSAFIRWSMDGPAPVPIASVDSDDTLRYRVALTDENEPAPIQLTIHRIDPLTKLSVFEYVGAGEVWYELRVPAENVRYFPIIVNYCRDEKQSEYSFESIDFNQLLSR